MIKHFYIIVSLIEGRYELQKFKSLLNLILSSTAVVTLPHYTASCLCQRKKHVHNVLQVLSYKSGVNAICSKWMCFYFS